MLFYRISNPIDPLLPLGQLLGTPFSLAVEISWKPTANLLH
jgi:hypothetical protein